MSSLIIWFSFLTDFAIIFLLFLFNTRKRAPPSTVYQLLQKYNDGILLKFISKNGFLPTTTSLIVSPSSSILTTVPTDYQLIERSNRGARSHCGNANSQPIICDYQVALDALGVDKSQMAKTIIVQNRMKLKCLRAFLLVVALILAIQSPTIVSYVTHYFKPFQLLLTVNELDSGIARQSKPSQEQRTNTTTLSFEVPDSRSHPVDVPFQGVDDMTTIDENDEGTPSIGVILNENSERSVILTSNANTEEYYDAASLEDEERQLKSELQGGILDSSEHHSSDTSVSGAVARIVVPEPLEESGETDLSTQMQPPERQLNECKDNAALRARRGLQKHFLFLKTEYLTLIEELGVIE